MYTVITESSQLSEEAEIYAAPFMLYDGAQYEHLLARLGRLYNK